MKTLWGHIQPERVVWILIGLYAIYFSAYSVLQHYAFKTYADLSFIAQPLWNTLHGDFLRLTIDARFATLLQDHFAPSYLLLVPLYAIWTSPVCLLVLQSLTIAVSAWPIFRLVEQQLNHAWLGVGYAIVYLLYPSLQTANLFDFHGGTLAAALFPWLYYTARQKHWRAFATLAIITAGFREEMALMLLMLGGWLSLQRSTRRAGLWTMLGAVLYFAFVLFMLAQTVSLESRYQTQWPSKDATPVDIGQLLQLQHLWGALIQPDRTYYLLHVFAPVGYLSLLAPEMLVPALPLLALNLFSDTWVLRAPAAMHYNAPLTAFVVLAASLGSFRLSAWLSQHTKFRLRFWKWLLFLYVAMLSIGYQIKLPYLPFSPLFVWPQVTAHDQLGEEIARQIPPDASVSAQNPLISHVCQRKNVSIFPDIRNADYIFLDLTRSASVKADGHDLPEKNAAIQQWLADPNYTTVKSQDGYVVLRRKE